MPKTREKSTARKPLVDISNGGKRSRPGKKKAPAADRNNGDGAIDRLLLARSDLSDLVAQVDELVTRALANKTMDKSGGQVIESFRNVLCDMHSSLKAWVPRLQHAFADTSTKTEHELRHTTNDCSVSAEYGDRNALPNSESKDKLEVSPSPLVSWRAGTCTVDCGRQLFLLTPLPKSTLLSSKRPGLSRSMVARNTIVDCHVSCGIPTLANDVKNGDDRGIVDGMATSFEFSKPCTTTRNSTTGTEFISPLIVSNQKNKNCEIPTLANDVKNGDDRGIVDGVATSFEFSKPCTTARNSTTGTEFISPLIVSNQKSKNCGIPTLANDVKNGDDHGIVDGVATSFEFSKPCTTARNSTTGTEFVSPLIVSNQKCKNRSIFIMTPYPYLQKSPPKTCPLLNPVSSREDDKSKNEGPHTSDGPPSEEFIENMASKYQELFGLQANYNHAGRRKEVDESLDWFLSPPKTCVLMEPSDEKLIPTPANVIVLATPNWNGENTIREGNKVGENTLKRELWTKFEAATSSEPHFNASTFQNTAKKGFLDMLEEVS